jgi:hypothetical protein
MRYISRGLGIITERADSLLPIRKSDRCISRELTLRPQKEVRAVYQPHRYCFYSARANSRQSKGYISSWLGIIIVRADSLLPIRKSERYFSAGFDIINYSAQDNSMSPSGSQSDISAADFGIVFTVRKLSPCRDEELCAYLLQCMAAG